MPNAADAEWIPTTPIRCERLLNHSPTPPVPDDLRSGGAAPDRQWPRRWPGPRPRPYPSLSSMVFVARPTDRHATGRYIGRRPLQAAASVESPGRTGRRHPSTVNLPHPDSEDPLGCLNQHAIFRRLLTTMVWRQWSKTRTIYWSGDPWTESCSITVAAPARTGG